MLIRNNPDIDFDRLNARIQARLERDAERHSNPPPDFDPNAKPRQTHRAVVDTLPDLLALHDREFVEQGYLWLLRRPANPDELEHCLSRLRAGEDKGQVLAWISFAPDADRRHGPWRQLRGNRLKYRLSHLPLLGGLVAMLYTWVLAHPFRRHLNAHLNQLYQRLQEQQGWIQTGVHERHALQERQQHQEQRLAESIGRIQAQSKQQAGFEQRLAEQQAGFEQRLAEQQAGFEQRLAEQRAGFEQRLAEHDRTIERLLGEIAILKLRLSQAADAGAPAAVTGPDHDGTTEPPVAPTDDALYIALESHFRGAPEAIRERLAYYLPLVREQTAWRRAAVPVVDIGCGRGEWLSLLADREGIVGFGVDLNRHNIRAGQTAGLHLVQADALRWLQAQPADSIGLVTSFHLIEHLPFETLGRLLREIARVLVPGGLLILETPNPENLVTAATNFHMDPTHLRPLPPNLMQFLVDYHGFTSIQLHRLHPVDEAFALNEHTETAKRCNQYFYGPQDYAITAIKPMADGVASSATD
jgi:SAM-dependent methyltransferase